MLKTSLAPAGNSTERLFTNISLSSLYIVPMVTGVPLFTDTSILIFAVVCPASGMTDIACGKNYLKPLIVPADWALKSANGSSKTLVAGPIVGSSYFPAVYLNSAVSPEFVGST